MTYAITGSTGGFGSSAISHLLNEGVKPSSIVALARNEEKAADYKSKGIDVRIGNYDDSETLKQAFQGIDRILLISSSEVGKRFKQHSNVIEAAKIAGVKQIVYTSLTKADISTNPLAPEHKLTEAALKESGLDYVILRNNWYTENYLSDVQYSDQTGVIATAADKGKVASVTKAEYAEAAVKVLIGEGYSGKTFEFSGELWDFNQLAKAAGKIFKKEIRFSAITAAERKSNLLHAGMDEGLAGFFTALDETISQGSLEINSKDLEEILGRAPLNLEEGLKSLLI